MTRDFVTSRPPAFGERFLPCQNKTLSNGLVKTSERANRRPRKPANLSAKKWNTSAQENMARVRRSRPLRLACPRRGVPGSNCRRRGAPGNERKDRPDAIWPGAGAVLPNGHRARVHARPHAPCAAKAAQPRPAGVYPGTPRKSRADADLLRALAPPKKPPGREREDASCAVRWLERVFATFAASDGAPITAPVTAPAPRQFPLAKRPSSSLLHASQRVFKLAVGPWVCVAGCKTTLARGNPAQEL